MALLFFTNLLSGKNGLVDGVDTIHWVITASGFILPFTLGLVFSSIHISAFIVAAIIDAWPLSLESIRPQILILVIQRLAAQIGVDHSEIGYKVIIPAKGANRIHNNLGSLYLCI